MTETDTNFFEHLSNSQYSEIDPTTTKNAGEYTVERSLLQPKFEGTETYTAACTRFFKRIHEQFVTHTKEKTFNGINVCKIQDCQISQK